VSDIPGGMVPRSVAWAIVREQMYYGRKCPYCGREMTDADRPTAIVADDANRSPCHEECWIKHLEEAEA